MKVAYLASTVTLPGSTTRRDDAFEHDQMMECLRAAFQAHGGEITDVSWDDPKENWKSFDAAIIGTCWDYFDRQEEFLKTLSLIETQTKLFNSASIVRWNIHKSYLKDLGEKGARLIPTLWFEKPSEVEISKAFEKLNTDTIICKRMVGAGAEGQHLLKQGQPIPQMSNPMMVQPKIESIVTEGEYSFIFVDNELSHCLLKRAAPGDYRIQSLYGGKEFVTTPDPKDKNAALDILKILPEAPLYSRVDMVRGSDGQLLLMELELIEPFLYPLQGPELGERLYRALEKRLT